MLSSGNIRLKDREVIAVIERMVRLLIIFVKLDRRLHNLLPSFVYYSEIIAYFGTIYQASIGIFDFARFSLTTHNFLCKILTTAFFGLVVLYFTFGPLLI